MQEWGGIEIPQRLMNALQARGIEEPSPIQTLTMPKLSEGTSVIIQAPTGCGKTLAYLIPVLARLQPTLHVGLQALILVPSPELALQITRELRWLFEVLCGPERACWFNPQVPRELGCEVLLSRRGLWDSVRKDLAVMVTTPSLVLSEMVALQWQAKKFTEALAYFMCSNIGCIVFDEVDALCTKGSPSRNPKRIQMGATEKVIEFLFDVVRSRYRNRPVQLIAASATANSNKVGKTLERMIDRKYKKRFQAAQRMPPLLIQYGQRSDQVDVGEEVKSWVKVPETITHSFATIRHDQDDRFGKTRLEAVAKIVKTLEGTIMVFVPEKVKLDAVVVFLQEAGVENVRKYRSSMGLGQDTEQLADRRVQESLVAREKHHMPLPEAGSPSEFALRRSQEFVDSLAQGQTQVLIVKADTIRGLDLQDVMHVVFMQFPASSMDYLHMCGRTGRMGRAGNAISIVHELEADMVRSVVEVRLGIRFDDWDTEQGKVLPAV